MLPAQGSELELWRKDEAIGRAPLTVAPARACPRRELSILVVDDSDENRYLMKVILAQHFARIGFVSSGVEALEELKASHYDLIFMDLQMPELDGLATVRAIRAQARAQDLFADRTAGQNPIVVLTGFAQPSMRHEAFEAGCNGYLVKPVSRREILAAIEKLTSAHVAKVLQNTEQESGRGAR